MSGRFRRSRRDLEEQTRPVTGADASMDEAEVGDAGDGAGPFGGGFGDGLPLPMEADPGLPADILPDRIERLEGRASEEEITAWPSEPPPRSADE